jgi:hypothetical protein
MAIESLLGNFTLQWEFALFGGYLICLVIWFVLWIVIAVWVYRDAEERGMSGALWLIIVILTGLIGLIIYMVVRTDTPQYGYYPQQQQPYQPYPPYQQQPPPGQAPPPAATAPPAQPPGAARFCSNCGGTLPEGAAHCPNCGAKV